MICLRLYQSKQTVKSAENSFGSTESRPSESVAEDVPVATRMPNNDAAISDDRELIPHAKHDALNSEQDCEDGIMNEKKWQAQFNTVKSEYSVLHGAMIVGDNLHVLVEEKYNALLREHDTILVEKATAVKELSACKANIAQLTQQLETSRSKQPESTTQACVSSEKDKEAQEKRIKMLEVRFGVSSSFSIWSEPSCSQDNLAQLNGYADQLEIVIARCPSCTVKLQNESTQDSLTNRGE
ncbi:hypothetical protein PsorP6_000839 [Peronosclerospora sorghi]|uniref:Uncharacterized protein n=1 Tax=Peronosclerospora sorghi TaxID=230839 RepID=A0ACC0WW05_9STRA|nr:hypothetical protein PsorP6_000839 [Peronosclerospora sorghi]